VSKAVGGASVISFPGGDEISTVATTQVSLSAPEDASVEEQRILSKLREIGAVPAKEFFAGARRVNPIRDRIRERSTSRAFGRMAQAATKAGLLSPIALQRMNAGLTQTQLASRLRVHQSQVARWESPGQFDRIAVGNLRRIAKVLDVDVANFFLGGQE
jgi:hypothetical protein